MKYSNMLLFGFVLFALAACSSAIPEPTETIVPSETPLPTETIVPSETPLPTSTPTITITPSPTLPPTITPTPTQSPTQIAGALGLLINCNGSYNVYDLRIGEFARIENQSSDSEEDRIKVNLIGRGFSQTFVDNWDLPDTHLDHCWLELLTASPNNDSFLLYQYGRSPCQEKIIWVSTGNQEMKELLTGEGFARGSPHDEDIILSKNTNEVFIWQYGSIDGEIVGELYVVNFDDGRVQNITEAQNLPSIGFGVSPDSAKISYSTINGNLWIYDRNTNKHTRLYSGFGYIKITDWNPSGDNIMFWQGGDVFLIGSNGSNLTNVQMDIGDLGTIIYPHWSPDGKLAATIEKDKDISGWVIIDIDTGEKQIYKIPYEKAGDERIYSFAYTRFNWSPDYLWFTTSIWTINGQYIKPRSFLCNRLEANCFELNKYPDREKFSCSFPAIWLDQDN